MNCLRQLFALALFGSVVGFSLAAQAATEKCPVEGFDSEKFEEAARAAPSCAGSFEIMKQCGSGASGDVGLGAVVTERCEAEFIHRLGKSERQAYRRARERCARKYRQKLGTMYRSFEAFCGAEVALSFARRSARRSGAQGG